MANVFRPSVTRPIPKSAVIVEKRGKRVAQWKGHGGKIRTAQLDESGERIREQAQTYTAEYRDATGEVVRQPTGFRDRELAMQDARRREKLAAQIRDGLETPEAERHREHLQRPVQEVVTAYLGSQKAKGLSAWHRSETERRLHRIVRECGFLKLRDINVDGVRRWQSDNAGMGARTRNTYVASLRAMCRWAVKEGLLPRDSLEWVEMASESADRRRVRRALTDREFHMLLHVARLRPLAEFGREVVKLAPERCEGRKTWTKAELVWEELEAAEERGRQALAKRPLLVARLERDGRERVLIYATLVLTGLRRGELASLRVDDLSLDGSAPALQIRAANAKARRAQAVPLRADLADELKAWVKAQAKGPEDLLFRVPAQLVKILKRDLKAAGIAAKDNAGRVLDVHALRHTTASHLAKGEVAPRTAQAIMRHSDISLTMNTYTDDTLLDQRAALDALPALRHPDGAQFVAGFVAVTRGSEEPKEARTVSETSAGTTLEAPPPGDVNACRAKRRRPRSTGDSERHRKAGEGSRTLDIQLGKLTFYH